MKRLDEFVANLEKLVAGSIGHSLSFVEYRTIQGECDTHQLASGVGYIGGEVRLGFGGMEPIFVGWGENDGWEDHFSLAVQSVTTFKPNALVTIPASAAPEWAPHIGNQLISASCRGVNNTPHALVFEFPSGGVILADGHENEIVDGDDLIILPLSACDIEIVPQLFWTSGAP